jgi:hypothetical protein
MHAHNTPGEEHIRSSNCKRTNHLVVVVWRRGFITAAVAPAAAAPTPFHLHTSTGKQPKVTNRWRKRKMEKQQREKRPNSFSAVHKPPNPNSPSPEPCQNPLPKKTKKPTLLFFFRAGWLNLHLAPKRQVPNLT